MKRICCHVLILISIFFLSGCGKVIEDGRAGVKIDLGRISEKPLNTGIHFYLPLITRIENWNVKLQEVKETATVPSSEGLISRVELSVIYSTPRDSVVNVRKTIGRRYRETVLIPYIRESIRNVLSGFEVKALFNSKGRGEITEEILSKLKGKLEAKGIVVQDVLLRDVILPPAFSQSIEAKLRTEQEALQKEFELLKAKKDAEIEIERAKGVAKSNEIIAESLTENYLRYRWIQGLHDGNSEVIYVPTEATLPILEAGRMSK